MNKNRFVLFISLFVFWLILSTSYDFQHILIGLILAAGVTWLWREAADLLPNGALNLKVWIKFFRFLLFLAWEVLLANIAVMKIALTQPSEIEPEFVHFQSNIKTTWGRVILANSITLTPGTVTVDVNPDNGDFLVHGLTKKIAEDVVVGKLIKRVEELEVIGGAQ